MSKVRVYSEIGDLEGVILHAPGPEVENMTPKNAERALYSDILNLPVAQKEYNMLECTLQQLTETHRVQDLLKDILESNEVKEKVVRKTCMNDQFPKLQDQLLDIEPADLSRVLIEGVPLKRDTLTSFLSDENYSLRPLHNFFFTRDASIALHDRVLIGKMANKVREREALIMDAIFSYHPKLRAQTVFADDRDFAGNPVHIEGGDVLIPRKDILLIGIGTRTTTQGVDYIIEQILQERVPFHIIVQELPAKPESFIHLDMAFTMLDHDKCLVYAPLILQPNRYNTAHIEIDNGKVKKIQTVESIPAVLKKLGMDLEPLYCGGRKDPMIQEREQWHSGANFFAFGPGKVIGYSRNIHTLEEMNKHGFEIIKSRDLLGGKVKTSELDRAVITIEGSELARGGGGARCMTMPFRRN